ncbi:exonuclease SbcCD subunit D C-terminal domain-containing protein [Desulfobacterota bacterium M19]
MKILHTSDWHLGRSLYGRKRYDESGAFLDWLSSTIENEQIDALLIAGDIFDISTPSNRAQELYYRFLCRVSNSCCRHIVVIAGNHDSPSFLNAPGELLRVLNVYVVGAMAENPEDEVFVLRDGRNRPQAVVCAVPYLRDRDIRTVEPGESVDDKNTKLALGIRRHYAEVCAVAVRLEAAFRVDGRPRIPIIAMGHLFTIGGKTVDGDGVRELYVGSLAHMDKEMFPVSIDYLALGHLHVPQQVGDAEHMRYSGSPVPMGYGEAAQEKKVVVVEFNGAAPLIKELPIPCFQPLERIVGGLDDICERIKELKRAGSTAWLEVEYTGTGIVANLRDTIDEALTDSAMELRRIKNKPLIERVMGTVEEDETLDDLKVNDVFERCLEAFDVPFDERNELINSYNEIIHDLLEEDENAE